MKVLALNGSPNKNGNTYQALQIVAKELEDR
jgi:multimeric flavodoxin WrbA